MAKVEKAKAYDMILYAGRFTSEMNLLLRPFANDEEKEGSKAQHGNLKFGVTVYKFGFQGSAWPRKLMQSLPAEMQGLKGMCRAYYLSPEFLPHHFKWERVDDGESDSPIFGGTLVDAGHRTARGIRAQREEAVPRFGR
jgi:hypothetical protein